MLKAASATTDNLTASPLKYDSALTPFTTRHGIPIFNFYEKDTQRSIRFAKAMAWWSKCMFTYSPFWHVCLTHQSESKHQCTQRSISVE